MDRARYLEPQVRQDLTEKMVFIAGARQVGKTTLAHRILATTKSGIYLNWDNRTDRTEIRTARWPAGEAVVALDEIHKWRFPRSDFSPHSPEGARERIGPAPKSEPGR